MVNILVVEDEPTHQQWMRESVVDKGRNISVTGTRSEALQLIANNDFDIVVTDLELESKSVEDGLDVLNAAKEKDPYTEVLVVTGHGNPALGVRAMGLGAFDYIQKSAIGVNVPAMLRAKVSKALELRRAQMEPRMTMETQ